MTGKKIKEELKFWDENDIIESEELFDDISEEPEVIERDCMACEKTFITNTIENADYCQNCIL